MSELKPANQHPDFGKVCSHGTLKRKCYICELEEEIDRLKTILKDETKAADDFTVTAAMLEEENKNLTEKLEEKYFSEVMLTLKSQNRRMREALEKIANRDYRGNRSPESAEAYKALKEVK